MQELSYRQIFHTLGKSVREYKKMSLWTPVLVILEVVIECILPFITAQLIDQLQAGCGMDVIMHYSAILIGMAILSLACGSGAGASLSIGGGDPHLPAHCAAFAAFPGSRAGRTRPEYSHPGRPGSPGTGG